MLKFISKTNFNLFAIILLISLSSCQKEEMINTTSSKEYPSVDKELWIYFERFEEEGKARGLDIDLVASGITGEIGATSSAMWVGQCNHNVDDRNHLIINQNFWNGANDLRREKIVFHELGHCYLERGHNESVLENGKCESIMRSGTGGCLDNYTEESRTRYCDELFNF